MTKTPSVAGALIDRFIPQYDVRMRHEIVVRAPSEFVFDVACRFDLRSSPAVRALFWLRSKILGAKEKSLSQGASGFVADMVGLGWGVLAEEIGRMLVAGAFCQPWKADVNFTAIPPEKFAAHVEPDYVKILWTLESLPLSSDTTLFSTETRVQATDDAARLKFRRYWWMFRLGIVMIRWLLLRAIRKNAESQWHASNGRCETNLNSSSSWFHVLSLILHAESLKNGNCVI